MPPEPIVWLPVADRARLAAAVHAVATEDHGRVTRLREGARESMAEAPSDADTARRFQNVLELGYLVASADGFHAEERTALARLLESITGAAVDHDALELHFRDLDQAVEALGRRERLARVAAELDDESAAVEAVGLAALIALSDGRLEQLELDVLVELGQHLAWTPERVRSVVEGVAGRVEAKLR
jgi:tellurite resistance protein